MNDIRVPKVLKEVFGERQTKFEFALTLSFAVIGCIFIYSYLFPKNLNLSPILLILGFLLIGDILAGCAANFTRGTNNYYANRSKSRWVFICIHIHIIIVAWLLGGPLMESMKVWAFTIAATIVVNVLKGNKLQLFIAAILLSLGIFYVFALTMPAWFALTSLFFMIKVLFSFAVDHYPKRGS